jgi:hypothetical protein
VTEAGRGDAVELAEGAVCGLVEHGNGVLGEEIALDAGEADTDAEIVEGVLGGGRVDLEPPMEAGEEGAIALQLESRAMSGRERRVRIARWVEVPSTALRYPRRPRATSSRRAFAPGTLSPATQMRRRLVRLPAPLASGGRPTLA